MRHIECVHDTAHKRKNTKLNIFLFERYFLNWFLSLSFLFSFIMYTIFHQMKLEISWNQSLLGRDQPALAYLDDVREINQWGRRKKEEKKVFWVDNRAKRRKLKSFVFPSNYSTNSRVGWNCSRISIKTHRPTRYLSARISFNHPLLLPRLQRERHPLQHWWDDIKEKREEEKKSLNGRKFLFFGETREALVRCSWKIVEVFHLEMENYCWTELGLNWWN